MLNYIICARCWVKRRNQRFLLVHYTFNFKTQFVQKKFFSERAIFFKRKKTFIRHTRPNKQLLRTLNILRVIHKIFIFISKALPFSKAAKYIPTQMLPLNLLSIDYLISCISCLVSVGKVGTKIKEFSFPIRLIAC